MTRLYYFAAAAAALAMTAPADAASGASKQGGGKTVLLSPLNFVNDTNLNFGTVVVQPGVAGSVYIDPDPASATPMVATNVTQIPTAAPVAGKMVGAGTAGVDVSVQTSFPSYLYLNGNLASPKRLPVSLELDTPEVSLNTHTYTINSAQSFEVYVGGTVTIPAGVVDGPYSNTYDITATYP